MQTGRAGRDPLQAGHKCLPASRNPAPAPRPPAAPPRPRQELYKRYVDQLVERGLAYPCFCTDEELEAMKKEAEAAKLPPIYRRERQGPGEGEGVEGVAGGAG